MNAAIDVCVYYIVVVTFSMFVFHRYVFHDCFPGAKIMALIEVSHRTKPEDVGNINLLLTEREGRTGEYWPEVVAVRTERSEVRTKTTEGQYSPVRLEQARLVSSLLYGTRVMLVSKLPAFENKKYTSYDHFHGNGPYGKIPTKKEPIRTPGFTPRLPCHIIINNINMLFFFFQYKH